MDSKEIKEALNNLIEQYIEKIGTIGEPNYNRELDNLCSDILDLKGSI